MKNLPTTASPAFITQCTGKPFTTNWGSNFYKKASPWHDVSLRPATTIITSNALFHYINEIPFRSFAKMEIQTKEMFNPIRQDTKKGNLRHLIYKGNGAPFNYGALPQTWEAPNLEPEYGLGYSGDNDPVDVTEISRDPLAIGAVEVVRVLGSIGLIDEGEMDWKVIAIALSNPEAEQLGSLHDLERLRPGY
eukprot:PhF_6_TR21698/c0_g1_i1/m.30985/K01507/ppa; inorganic pyrophosphatase